jgi:hypothetical protein
MSPVKIDIECDALSFYGSIAIHRGLEIPVSAAAVRMNVPLGARIS